MAEETGIFGRFRIRNSIAARVRFSFIVIMSLLILPVLISGAIMADYAGQYHRVITQVRQVSEMKPMVTETIPDEMFAVIAGQKKLEDGDIYNHIDLINSRLDELINNRSTGNQMELLVARRTMNTLSSYTDRLAQQLSSNTKVSENEAVLDEVRSVALLIGDMLDQFVLKEIADAGDESQSLQKMLGYILLAEAALVMLTLIFSAKAQHALVTAISVPIAKLESLARSLAAGDLQARVPGTQTEELVSLSESLNIMAGKLQDLIDENKREQENLKRSELRTLQAQIAPHFLYNTLDAIVWLAEADRNDEVIHITRALSDFFRISLSQGRDWIPLAEEVRHLQGYLTIQKIRYRDILDYEIDIPQSLYGYEILKLLLQPLVENAIYHGIKHRRGRGLVRVLAREENGALCASVADNGAGMSPERLEEVRCCLNSKSEPAKDQAGYGLYNVNKRIQLYYNQPEGIRIESGENGTTVFLRVPLKKAEEHDVQGISG